MRRYLHGCVWLCLTALCVALVAGTAAGRLDFSWVEVIGFVTGLLSVWLLVLESHWNWPIGNLNSAAFLWLFFTSRLYANSALQVLFIALGFWGWWLWLRRRDASAAPFTVRRAPLPVLAACVAAAIAGTVALRPLLQAVDGAAPFWDTFTTALSVVATYLMARKYVENFAFWVAADLIYDVLFPSRGLVLTGVLYLLFTALSSYGLFEWTRLYRTAGAAAAAPDGGVPLPSGDPPAARLGA